MAEEIDRCMDVLLGRMENENNEHPVVSADFIQLTVRPTQGGEYTLEFYTTDNGLHIECEEHELEAIITPPEPLVKGMITIPLDWQNIPKPNTKEVEDDHIQ
jgi:hypothetical protein